MLRVVFVLLLTTISICCMCIVGKTRQGTTIKRYRFRILIDLFIYLPKGHINPYINSIGWISLSVHAVILAISFRGVPKPKKLGGSTIFSKIFKIKYLPKKIFRRLRGYPASHPVVGTPLISLTFINPNMYELLKKPNSVHNQTQFNC
jgi:hypothetical protein